jgi:hypothetical protein
MSKAKDKWYRQSLVEALPSPNTLFPFQLKNNHRNILENILVLALAQEE